MLDMSWPAIMEPLYDYNTDKELFEKAQAFIRSGSVDVNAEYEGMMPLMYAVEQPELVKDLIVAGAKIDAVDDATWTALMCASARGRDDSAGILAQHGADLNAATTHGMTALMFAARDDYTGVAEVLVDHGADLNAVDEKGWTAMMHSLMSDCPSDDTPVYELLLERGADVTIRNKDGDTALDMMTSRGYTDEDNVVITLKAYLTLRANLESNTSTAA